jgi:AraC family transcriptional regulator
LRQPTVLAGTERHHFGAQPDDPAEIRRFPVQQLHGPITRTKVRGGLAKWQLDRVIDHIESRLADPIKVDELAQLAGLSASQFTRAFRRSTGVPPHRWHLSARIRRAQQLIRDTQQPLAEIAISIGFADQSHFANTFTRWMGVSPGAWRREQRFAPLELAAHNW